jgi:N-acetylmuramoyl-L-alanine amidase
MGDPNPVQPRAPPEVPLIANRRRRRRSAGASRLFGLAIGAVAVIAAVISVQALLNARAGAAETATAGAKPQAAAAGAAGQAARSRPGSRVLTVRSPDLPAGLVPGTCVQFDPTGADRHRTIYLDPGHGGPDPGAVGNGLKEEDLTLAVALQLKDVLRADGFHVVLSRVADTSVAKLTASQVVNGAITNSGAHLDTIARIACGNAAAADVMVAIHFNAFDDPSASGAETFYDDARDFSAANLRLANLLQAQLEASFKRAGWQVYDRGVLSDANTGNTGLTAAADAYGRLMELGPVKAGWNGHPSQMPGALVEPFFLTDPVEAQVVNSAAGQKAIAAGLEQGLVAFLAPPATGTPPASPTG